MHRVNNAFHYIRNRPNSRSRAHIVYQRLAIAGFLLTMHLYFLYVLGKILTETGLKIINGVKKRLETYGIRQRRQPQDVYSQYN